MRNRLTQQYKETDQIRTTSKSDPHSLLITCFDELLKSIVTFQKNVIPNTSNFRLKSSSFSRALTIIYTLQSSLDFEKDIGVAKSLFQIYEYTRTALISEFKLCKVEKSAYAVRALSEIKESWQKIEQNT